MLVFFELDFLLLIALLRGSGLLVGGAMEEEKLLSTLGSGKSFCFKVESKFLSGEGEEEA